jgi:hypothetical protein
MTRTVLLGDGVLYFDGIPRGRVTSVTLTLAEPHGTGDPPSVRVEATDAGVEIPASFFGRTILAEYGPWYAPARPRRQEAQWKTEQRRKEKGPRR